MSKIEKTGARGPEIVELGKRFSRTFVLLLVSGASLWLLAQKGMEYAVLAPALSWAICYTFFYSVERDVSPITNGTRLAKWWTNHASILIGLCVVWMLGVGNNIGFSLGGISLDAKETLLLSLLICSSLIVSFSTGAVYRETVNLLNGVRESNHANSEGKLLLTLVISGIIFLAWPPVTGMILNGERIAFYKGDWLFGVVIACTYFAAFFILACCVRLCSIWRRQSA